MNEVATDRRRKVIQLLYDETVAEMHRLGLTEWEAT